MVKPRPAPHVSSNKKIFHDGAYKIAASTKTDAIIIFRRQESGKYKQADIVTGTNNNYQAAVKRINRMHARDKSAAMISGTIFRIAQAAEEAVTPTPRKVKTLNLERKIQDDLEQFSQSSFSLPSNISTVVRNYLIRTTKKKSVGTKTILEATLYLVVAYDLNKLVKIDHLLGVSCVKKALERAKLDAATLKPAEIVIQIRSESTAGDATNFCDKRIAYIGQDESVEHVQQGLTNAIDKFFLRLNTKKP